MRKQKFNTRMKVMWPFYWVLFVLFQPLRLITFIGYLFEQSLIALDELDDIYADYWGD